MSNAVRKIDLDNASGVKTTVIRPEQDYLLAIEPSSTKIKLHEWLSQNRSFTDASLSQYGAILFRNFELSPADFKSAASQIGGEDVPYTNGGTPRARSTEGLYLASAFPPENTMPQHHEMSYMRTWPMKVFFYCDLPASVGGETPICSTRTFMEKLDPSIVRKFAEKGVTYVRKYNEGVGLGLASNWEQAFSTTDRQVVEQICRDSKMEFEWTGKNGLRTWYTAQGVTKHPQTKEVLWHNHALIYATVSDVPGAITPNLRMNNVSQDRVNRIFAANRNDLTFMAYYGDGSLIELSTLEQINSILESEKVSYEWRKGDFIMLDNLLSFHGRNPFQGERRILTILKEKHS